MQRMSTCMHIYIIYTQLQDRLPMCSPSFWSLNFLMPDKQKRRSRRNQLDYIVSCPTKSVYAKVWFTGGHMHGSKCRVCRQQRSVDPYVGVQCMQGYSLQATGQLPCCFSFFSSAELFHLHACTSTMHCLSASVLCYAATTP
ncbi:hypothetical protein GUJ93_ZPchr0006g45298 [Zizania palustris]|uniref:Uncharacterized protein n=1 Tax=Zizania palustris TaxID=103762 RepID=A0A8J5SV95_ZIZPA|nr:hypothetical protein GUJ93_ZPchr0006g45298 [Zizania palustris]